MWILALSLPTLAIEPSEPDPAYIINGTAATEDDYPMTGAILFGGDGPTGGYQLPMLWCSSTLIAPDVVLTAGHCVDEELIDYYFPDLHDTQFRWSRTADLGAYDGSSRHPWPDDAIPGAAWVTHPDYSIWDYGTGITQNDDVALLFLSEAVLDVPYAYVPTVDEGTQLAVDSVVEVVGWGQQQADMLPGTYGVKQMGESFVAELGEYEFQVGLARSDVRQCHGDSGGPVFMDVESNSVEPMRIVGLTSHSYDDSDCQRTGGVDTRVDKYLDWIDQEMRARCDDGTRVWCDEPGILWAPVEEEPDDTGVIDDTGGAEDTGLSDDTGTDTHRPPQNQDVTAGCGCSASPTSAPWAALLLLVPLWARRRR